MLYLKDYASYIPDNMVSEFADINQDMMISIDLIPIPTDEAVREAQTRLLEWRRILPTGRDDRMPTRTFLLPCPMTWRCKKRKAGSSCVI